MIDYAFCETATLCLETYADRSTVDILPLHHNIRLRLVYRFATDAEAAYDQLTAAFTNADQLKCEPKP